MAPAALSFIGGGRRSLISSGRVMCRTARGIGKPVTLRFVDNRQNRSEKCRYRQVSGVARDLLFNSHDMTGGVAGPILVGSGPGERPDPQSCFTSIWECLERFGYSSLDFRPPRLSRSVSKGSVRLTVRILAFCEILRGPATAWPPQRSSTADYSPSIKWHELEAQGTFSRD